MRDRYIVKMHLKLHAITCPGVWLCSHGYLEVTIKLFGYLLRTGIMEPRFPILAHETFLLEGFFHNIETMDELIAVLSMEKCEITLWQNGRRLAYVAGKIVELFNNGIPKLCWQHDVNVQVLMKTTSAFPGIISPKAELSINIIIQDRLSGSSLNSEKVSDFFKSLDHQNIRPLHAHRCCPNENCGRFTKLKFRRQKPVCHAFGTLSHSSIKLCSEDHSNYDCSKRRLSACSSYLSDSTNQTLPSSASAFNNKIKEFTETPENKIHVCNFNCQICQTYNKLFLQ